MADDIARQILAAIEETERLAEEANAGPWHVDNETFAESIYSADDTCVIGGGRWGGEASVFDSNADALHIARNDPAAVLRRCAADRKIVHMYRLLRAQMTAHYNPDDAARLGDLRFVVEHLADSYGVAPATEPADQQEEH